MRAQCAAMSDNNDDDDVEVPTAQADAGKGNNQDAVVEKEPGKGGSGSQERGARTGLRRPRPAEESAAAAVQEPRPVIKSQKTSKKSGTKDSKKKVRKTNITRRPKRSTYSEHVRDHYSSWENTSTLISPGMWRLFLDNRRYDVVVRHLSVVGPFVDAVGRYDAAGNFPTE